MASVSIVIPTRNEEANINRLLLRLMKYDYEIVIVDDSDDATAVIANSLGAKVILGQRKGLGQAIIDGINWSNGDIVMVMDADMSHPTNAIPSLIEPIKDGDYDMTIGSRYVDGGEIDGWTAKRKLISMVASNMAYPLTRIRDNTSGFFAFRRSLLNGHEIKADSWKIMLEVLVKTKPLRYKECPITFTDRQAGKSKFNKKEVWAYLKHLWKLSLYKYRMIKFMIVGGIGFCVNMATYYPLTLLFENEVTFLGQHFYLPPFIISSVIAITSNYTFNKYWTFNDRKAKRLSYFSYLGMGLITLLLDMVLLWLFVDYGGITPMLSAAIAIIIAFITRFIVADKWIWHKSKR